MNLLLLHVFARYERRKNIDFQLVKFDCIENVWEFVNIEFQSNLLSNLNYYVKFSVWKGLILWINSKSIRSTSEINMKISIFATDKI